MQKYQYSAEELKLIEESSISCAVYQFIDKRVVTIAVSDGFRQLLGLSTLEETYDLMDNDMYRDVHPDDVVVIADAAVRFATQGGDYDVIYRSKVGDKYIILHAQGKHIYKLDGTRLAVVNYFNEGNYKDGKNDFTLGLKQQFETFIARGGTPHKANYDYLTGLPDEDYFFEIADAIAKKAEEEDRTAYLAFLNVKDMKSYNQKNGYAEGDVLIQEVAKTLVRFFGNNNCSRMTADHFAFYYEGEQIQEQLDWLVSELKHINCGKNMPVGIGVYSSRLGWVGATTACDWAKVACETARNTFESTIVYFDEAMLKKYEDRRYIFENLDRAIDEGWIQVYFQPIIRAANGRVSDEEALVRWIDPERGMLTPADFVPILEEAKISYKMDLFVVDEVIKKLKVQAQGGLYVVPNSVNLSRTDFYACDMVEEIRKRVEAAELDPSKITIEITESYVMEDVDFMRRQVDRFHKLGFHVWMDDFGSGYSTMDLLQKIHFDVIKIDKSFVDRIEEDESSRILITELVRLISGLGMETVAEGVESLGQVDFLKEIGCTRLQGYNYCHPIPLAKILERYDKGEQIGFENPDESDYYTILGNINLYDFSFFYESMEESGHYFDTMPISIIEAFEDHIHLVRGNKSFRDYMERYFSHIDPMDRNGMLEYTNRKVPQEYFKAIQECCAEKKDTLVDVRNGRGDLIHMFMRYVSENPVTGAAAVVAVVLSCVDYDVEMRRQEEQNRIEQERKMFNRIIALSGDYLSVFSVDPETDHYVEFSASNSYKGLNIATEGEDFYGDSQKNGASIVYVEDLEVFQTGFTKENVMAEIEQNGVFVLNYRLRLSDTLKYVSLKATLLEEEDGKKLIFGLLDTDAQVKKDEEYSRKLMAARDIANLDALTGVKNKHAYADAEAQVDTLIERGEIKNFAVVVFDINGLKEVNDTKGHQAGDKYITEGCHAICRVFKHSPVFRVGGDEFVAIVQGEDYHNINMLMKKFEKCNEKNQASGKVVVAAGMSKCRGDKNISSVFKRADAAMYRNKKALKAME